VLLEDYLVIEQMFDVFLWGKDQRPQFYYEVDDQEEEKEVDIRIRLEKEMFKVSGDKSSCITIVLEVTKCLPLKSFKDE
jgi:hypothetical protein